MKRIPLAVIGALALAFAGSGFAQGSGGMSSSGNSAAPSQDLSKSYKSSDLVGLSVQNRQNQSLGSISELIVDRNGYISNVVLNEVGATATGGNRYIVPWNRIQLRPDQNVAVVDVDKTALPAEFSAFEEGMTAPVSGTPSAAPSGNTQKPPSSDSGGKSGGAY